MLFLPRLGETLKKWSQIANEFCGKSEIRRRGFQLEGFYLRSG
jgi:hypothetical protein